MDQIHEEDIAQKLLSSVCVEDPNLNVPKLLHNISDIRQTEADRSTTYIEVINGIDINLMPRH